MAWVADYTVGAGRRGASMGQHLWGASRATLQRTDFSIHCSIASAQWLSSDTCGPFQLCSWDCLTQLELCSAVLHVHLQTDALFLNEACDVELVVRPKRFRVVLMDQVGTQAVSLL